MISQKAVDEFRELVEKKRGIKLSDSETRTMATEWLEFFKLIYRPIPNEK